MKARNRLNPIQDSSELEEFLDFDFTLEDLAELNEELGLSDSGELLMDFDDEEDSHLDEIVDRSVGNSDDEDHLLGARVPDIYINEDKDDLSEDDLEDILSTPLVGQKSTFDKFDADVDSDISLSTEELLKIESEDPYAFVDSDTNIDRHFADQISDRDDSDITLDTSELDHILSAEPELPIAHSGEEMLVDYSAPDEDNLEVEVDGYETSPEVSLGDDDLGEEENVSLSDSELDHILESEDYSDEEEEYGKSFFDSEDAELPDLEFDVDDAEESDSITLSPDELGNITGEEESFDGEGEFITDMDSAEDSITLSP
ncbi:MAG TPA: hypothetical protein PKN56_22775, partial [Leptospiraceae bacterium]|nr:hypothetical protein [Leptospiraceae bacterium]HNO22480.1 hypothetical protein [Leptospiraceae bacterium]